MKSSAHGELEKLWDEAVTYVAIQEGYIRRTRHDQPLSPPALVQEVTFVPGDCKRREIEVRLIPKGGLMSPRSSGMIPSCPGSPAKYSPPASAT